MLVPVRVLSRGDVQGLDAAVAAFVAGRAEELGAGEPVTLAESDYARR
jgi:hypothetical protein